MSLSHDLPGMGVGWRRSACDGEGAIGRALMERCKLPIAGLQFAPRSLVGHGFQPLADRVDYSNGVVWQARDEMGSDRVVPDRL